MDAPFSLEGLVDAFGDLLAARDFEGAETLLYDALERAPAAARSFVHFQLGRLYREWNKLTSAIDHLNRATEVTGPNGSGTNGLTGLDPFLRMQIVEELKVLKEKRAKQCP